MTIKILNKKLNLDGYNNVILFSDSNLNIKGLNTGPFKKFKAIIEKSTSLNKSNIKDFHSLDLSSSLKIIIVKINEDISLSKNNEKLGAKFYEYINSNSIYKSSLIDSNISFFLQKNSDFIDEFISGIFIKSYNFEKYKTKKNLKSFFINLSGKIKINFFKKNNRLKSIIDGLNLTKDLVSEPGNILHPDEYVSRIRKLRSLGLKVTIFDRRKMKKLGMNALLGVGQGSIRGSYLAAIEWRGSNKKQQPLAFVGKGVCFDTGGISLKPAKFMEDMTYDMAGSAVVVGLMKTLALR